MRKCNVDAIWLVHNESTFAVAVIGNMELVANVADGFGIKPDLTVVHHMGLHVGGQNSTISMDSHGLICLTHMGGELAVAEEIKH
jgi:hypothetical protein